MKGKSQVKWEITKEWVMRKISNYSRIRGKTPNWEIARRLGFNEASVCWFLTKYLLTRSKEGKTYGRRSRIWMQEMKADLKQLQIKIRFQPASKLNDELINIIYKHCRTSTVRRRSLYSLRTFGLQVGSWTKASSAE